MIISSNPFPSKKFSNILKREGIDTVKKIIVGETLTLIYMARKYGVACVHVSGVKKKLPFATFPSKKTKKTLRILNKLKNTT